MFDQMYAADSSMKDRPAEMQAQTFFDRFLVYSDSFSRGMRSLGNESMEILCNADHVQKVWARENGFTFFGDEWIQEIMLAQIEELRTVVIYIRGMSRDPQEFLSERSFRAERSFVGLVVAYSGVRHDVTRFDAAMKTSAEFSNSSLVAQSIESHHA